MAVWRKVHTGHGWFCGSDFSRGCAGVRCAARWCIERLQRRDAAGRCRAHIPLESGHL